MTAAFLAVAVMPLLAFGYFAFQVVSSSVEEHIQEKNSLLAQSLAREVRDYLFRARDILHYTARTMETEGVLQDPSAFLQTIAGQFRFFDSIQVIDAGTGVIRHIAPHAPDFIGNDVSMSEYYQKTVETGETFWSRTFISSQSGHPSVTLSVPVGRLIAVGFLDLVRLNDISDGISFGATGQAAVTDHLGTLIAHRNRSFVAERRNIRNLEIVKNALAGREGTFSFAFEGEKWVGTSFHIPVPGWSVLVFQNASEARLHVNRIAAAILLGIAGAVVLAVLISLFWVKRLLKPMDRLVESARRIAQGNYKIGAQPKSYDEINQLNEAISAMTRAIRQREAALMKREEEYRLLVENANDLIFVSQDHRIHYANPRCLEITGYSRDEIVALDLADLVHPEDRNRVIDRHDQCAAGQNSLENFAFRMVDRDGRMKWGQLSAVGIQWGDRPAVLNFLRDITREKQLAAQLQQAQKMEAIGTLAGGVAHDFNNILSPILGYSEMLQNECRGDPRLSGWIQNMLTAGGRAKDLVRQILTFSRGGEEARQSMEIQPIVKEIVKFIQSSFPSTISIRPTIHPECPPILANPTQIHQVVMNLVTNAYHAMSPEGGVLEIELYPQTIPPDAASELGIKAGAYNCLRVSDTGPGIDSAHVDRIFEPYFTTKEKEKGTGLGLAVVHGIVRDGGGGIDVTSAPGKGTTFRIFFPQMAAQDHPVAAPLREPSKIPAPAGGKIHVLLVDDELPIVDMLREMLESMGHTVSAFDDSRAALDAFIRAPERFDLMITDMTMPNLTGARLAREALARRPDFPIILCTGFSDEVDENRAMDMGIRAYLLKPVEKEILGGAIAKAMACGAEMV